MLWPPPLLVYNWSLSALTNRGARVAPVPGGEHEARRLRIAACLSVVVLVLAARPSTAQIKAVTVQPEKPIVNFPATIRSPEMNPCGAMQVD